MTENSPESARETEITGHYTHGALGAVIRQALVAAGKDPDRLRPPDLAPVDEFHIGGREATAALFAQLDFKAGMTWLDIGSGLGGTARFLAETYGCRVMGIDLTPEYVEVANDLARRVGLADQVEFRCASALAMPFPTGAFDGASLIHVGMNIADKGALLGEAARVLRPGGMLALYEVMRLAPGDLDFPLPWAGGPATSFVATPDAYRSALADSGFAVVSERSRAGFALDFFGALRAHVAATGRPALGLHIPMGAEARRKTDNLVGAIERGLIAPVEIIAVAALSNRRQL